MKTNLTTLVASLSFLVTAAACSAPDGSEVAPPASTDEASSVVESAPGEPFVLVEGSASGYVLTALNSGATTEVHALDLSAAGVDGAATAAVLSTPGTIAARGAVRGDTFVASAVYRALPRVSRASLGAYYTAHVTPHAESATEVNVGKTRVLHRLDLQAAMGPYVDQGWISARVLDGAAVVQGSLSSGVLHATAVFVRLPDTVECTEPEESCGPGLVSTYARAANRCLVISGCARREMCPMHIPACAPGYLRSSWPGAHGCPTFACDPEFDPAP